MRATPPLFGPATPRRAARRRVRGARLASPSDPRTHTTASGQSPAMPSLPRSAGAWIPASRDKSTPHTVCVLHDPAHTSSAHRPDPACLRSREVRDMAPETCEWVGGPRCRAGPRASRHPQVRETPPGLLPSRGPRRRRLPGPCASPVGQTPLPSPPGDHHGRL